MISRIHGLSKTETGCSLSRTDDLQKERCCVKEDGVSVPAGTIRLYLEIVPRVMPPHVAIHRTAVHTDLSQLGVDHNIVTATMPAEEEIRCGRYQQSLALHTIVDKTCCAFQLVWSSHYLS